MIIDNIITLATISFFCSLILYWASKKFYVKQNPKIEKIEDILPAANCGACGYAGCKNFAQECINKKDLTELFCPVGGNEVMAKVAQIIGIEIIEKERTAAFIKCNGNCKNAPNKIFYTGSQICRLVNDIAVGQSGCPDGCIKFGDCIKACPFQALSFDEYGLPKVDKEKCTSCKKCVNICPRNLFEIRKLNQDKQTVMVKCSNKQKGAVAKKTCQVACIGCMKCTKISDQITINSNLSYIPDSIDAKDFGQQLQDICPTGAIVYEK